MENQQKVFDREAEIIFTNFTDEDFDGMWNKKIYRFKADKSYYLPLYLAEHFGKHLVDRELNKMVNADREKHPEVTDRKTIESRETTILGNLNLRQQLMDKCVTLTNPTQVGYVQPKEVPTREIILKTNERSAELVNSGKVSRGDLGPRNQPKEEKFEGLE